MLSDVSGVSKREMDRCYNKEWITYCKETFNGAQSVIDYLGKYTHRIAISNHRIISMTETTVTYAVKDYKKEGQWKGKTIRGEEFIRRFLMHVPPKGFVRIRHYGLLSNRKKEKKIRQCRNQIGCKKYISVLKELRSEEMIKLLYGIDVCKCSCCGGNMIRLKAERKQSQHILYMRCWKIRIRFLKKLPEGGLFAMQKNRDERKIIHKKIGKSLNLRKSEKD